MSKLLTPGQGRIVLQICAMTAVAALMSGCSADSTRFGDAFGNPFSTGSIQQKPKKVAHATPSLGTGRTPPVTTSALPPANRVASAAPFRAPPAVSHETTGSIPSSTPVKGASFGGWTGQGGAAVQVGAGDSAAVLAQRYGVPENVLLQTNGLHAAGEVHPGITIVIPIYNAVASSPGAARVAQAAPVRAEPVEPEERAAPVRTVPAHVARAEPEEAPAEPARSPAPMPFKVEKPATLAERNAEAQRIVATQRAADKAAADKLAAAQKAAEAQKLAEVRKAEAAEKVAAAEKAKADAAARKLAKAPAAHADPKVAAAQKAEAAKVAAAAKAAAAQKLAADHEATKAKAEAARSAADAQKTAAAAAKAAKVAAAKPAPAAAAPKAEQVAVAEKKVDATPTASLPPTASAAPAAAPAAPVVADSGGPEFRWPARGRIIAGFKGGTGGNDGINIAVPEGTQVKAAEGGVVAYAGNELKGYGNLVLIRHPNGYVTAYANNGEIDVKRGETVKRGEVIAKSGQSGNVSSPQLHFEVRKGSTPVDPTGMLAGT